jgi:hypothetical protein
VCGVWLGLAVLRVFKKLPFCDGASCMIIIDLESWHKVPWDLCAINALGYGYTSIPCDQKKSESTKHQAPLTPSCHTQI